jgi:hypothetical protein
MARPRVFISSTFYDLKQIRADLEFFVRELGYDAALSERGAVPYGASAAPAEYAYKEVELSDILVAVVGGRYGSSSSTEPYSVSQKELKTALDMAKQVFIFVEGAVWNEYSTYKINKDVEGIRYRFVDNVMVFRFLEELEALPTGNPISTFDTARDITEYLRAQWSGLFQRFLQEQSTLREYRLLQNIQSTATTLDQLVKFLTDERRNRDDAIKDILLLNHPAFAAPSKGFGYTASRGLFQPR